MTRFLKAISAGDLDEVKAHVNEKNINRPGTDGKTPLMDAVNYGKVQIAHFLISRGANVNLTDNSGNTALIYAVMRRDAKTASTLLQHGADASIVTNRGKTALDLAKNSSELQAILTTRDVENAHPREATPFSNRPPEPSPNVKGSDQSPREKINKKRNQSGQSSQNTAPQDTHHFEQRYRQPNESEDEDFVVKLGVGFFVVMGLLIALMNSCDPDRGMPPIRGIDRYD